jgi:hypothetical protein
LVRDIKIGIIQTDVSFEPNIGPNKFSHNTVKKPFCIIIYSLRASLCEIQIIMSDVSTVA